jgi:SAM-dependent methyltransferase
MDDVTEEEMKRRVARANESIYDSIAGRTYVDGAPHIKHGDLRKLYSDLLVGVFRHARQFENFPRVLDLGAGEGSVTLPMLELGAHVTAVDISEEQLSVLRSKCAKHESRLVVRCEDINDLIIGSQDKYDIITANSFLHHIPDYLGMLNALIPRFTPSGQFFSFQDPLLYSTQSAFARSFEGIAYASWRIWKGDVWKGSLRRLRRARGVYLPNSEHDNAEYHVLRDGVDQRAIEALFVRAGFTCDTTSYFSTQSRPFQAIGKFCGVKNTFAVVAARNGDVADPKSR